MSQVKSKVWKPESEKQVTKDRQGKVKGKKGKNFNTKLRTSQTKHEVHKSETQRTRNHLETGTAQETRGRKQNQQREYGLNYKPHQQGVQAERHWEQGSANKVDVRRVCWGTQEGKQNSGNTGE